MTSDRRAHAVDDSAFLSPLSGLAPSAAATPGLRGLALMGYTLSPAERAFASWIQRASGALSACNGQLVWHTVGALLDSVRESDQTASAGKRIEQVLGQTDQPKPAPQKENDEMFRRF